MREKVRERKREREVRDFKREIRVFVMSEAW